MSNYKPILGFPYNDNVGYEANLPAQEDDILNKIRDNAPVEMDTFKEVHDEIVKIKSKIDSISDSGLTTGDDVKEEINNVKEEIKEEIGEVKEELNSNIESAKNEVMTSVGEVKSKVDELESSVNTSIEEVKGSFNTSINTLSGTIETEISTAKADIENELSEVKDELGGYIVENKEKIETLSSTLETKVSLERFEELIGNAPEALDTLGEIASKLNGNGDAIEAIKGVLEGKVDKEKVAAIEEAVNGKQEKGDYVEYSDYQGRKTIQLKNYDSISGLMTNGGGVNLAMVSKYNVADFGSTQLQINLNGSKDRPTYNDDNEIALVNDIPSLDGLATEEWVVGQNYLTEHQNLDEYAKTTEVEEKIEDAKKEAEKTYQVKGEYVEWFNDGSRKHLRLANHDNIDALNSDGNDAANLVMLSRWNVADFGSVKYPINLNGSKDAPTYNDEKKIALQEWVEAKNYLTEHQSLADYATKEELNTKANADDVYTKTEIEEKGYLTEHQSLEEYAKTADVEAKYQEKGDYVEYGDYQGRKTIQLENYDSISGKMTDTPANGGFEGEAGGVNLAMVSKWNVADFGSTKLPINLNGAKARPTYNDDKEIALLNDIPNVENFITKDEVAETYQLKGEYPQWSEDVKNEKKTILMENNDSISGRMKSGIGANLVMVSKWDVADFGSKSVHMNLNGKFECPTYNDKDKIVLMKESGSEPGKYVLTLENADLIMGKTNQEELDYKVDVKQGAVTIAQVNKWNVVDLGSPKTLTNINVKDGERVTVQEASQSGQEAHKIAYLSDIDNLKAELTKHFDLLLKNYQLKSDDDIAKVINAGGDVVVAKDVKSTAGYTLTKDCNVDLNGHTLDAIDNGGYGDNIVIGNGANVTIKNGVINEAEKATQANASAVIIVKSTAATKLTLEDVEVTGGRPVYLNNANENTTVTIKSGTFTCTGENGEAVYVQKGGKVTIEGGYFSNPKATTYKGFLLNIKDNVREGKDPREFIEVKGGIFVNFDPSNNKAEGEGSNFVVEGYHVESKQDGDDIIYEVVKND